MLVLITYFHSPCIKKISIAVYSPGVCKYVVSFWSSFTILYGATFVRQSVYRDEMDGFKSELEYFNSIQSSVVLTNSKQWQNVGLGTGSYQQQNNNRLQKVLEEHFALMFWITSVNIHNIMAKQGFNNHTLKERTGKKSEEDTQTQFKKVNQTNNKSLNTPRGGGYHIRKTWVLGRKLGKNPEEELKSCFVDMAWNVFITTKTY